MPTHEELARFLREWAGLTPRQRTLFIAAVMEMVEDLAEHAEFRPSLRAKGVQGYPGIFEISWARDGRATFHQERRCGPARLISSGVGSGATASLTTRSGTPNERAAAIEHLDFAIAEFREMKMQPSLERARRHKDMLKA